MRLSQGTAFYIFSKQTYPLPDQFSHDGTLGLVAGIGVGDTVGDEVRGLSGEEAGEVEAGLRGLSGRGIVAGEEIFSQETRQE